MENKFITRSKLKRVSQTLQERIQILNECSRGSTLHDVSRAFSKKVGTVQSVVRRSATITRAIENGVPLSKKRLRFGRHIELESDLMNWIQNIRRRKTPVTGDLIKVSLFFLLLT